MTRLPTISVCIPAYNRVEVLPALLDSVLQQDYDAFEIVIVEDCSPERVQIRGVVEEYQRRSDRIRYFENAENRGYDGNLRETLARSTGEYCFFMGNDDLMCEGALRAVGEGIARHENVGVVLRTWAAFEGDPRNIVSTSRYFDDERFFPAGEDAIVTFYRRSVVIPGMVVHREAALACATDRFDGYTLYQCWVVGNLLAARNGLFLPRVTVLYRMGNAPLFGSSDAERGKFTPGTRTPEGSLFFLEGFFAIARAIEKTCNLKVARRIAADASHYSYPFLLVQAPLPFGAFTRYAFGVARAGLWRSPLFYVYYALLAVFGARRVDRMFAMIKKKLGHTPAIGGFSRGVGR